MIFFDEFIISDDYNLAMESYNYQLYDIAIEAFSKLRETLSNFCFKRSAGCKKRYKVCKSKGNDRLANLWSKWSIRFFKIGKFIEGGGVKNEEDVNSVNKEIEEAKEETNKLEDQTKRELSQLKEQLKSRDEYIAQQNAKMKNGGKAVGKKISGLTDENSSLKSKNKTLKEEIHNLRENNDNKKFKLNGVFAKAKSVLQSKKKNSKYTDDDKKKDEEYIKKLSKVKKITESFINDSDWDYSSYVYEAYLSANTCEYTLESFDNFCNKLYI